MLVEGSLNNLKESMIQFSKPRKLVNASNPVSVPDFAIIFSKSWFNGMEKRLKQRGPSLPGERGLTELVNSAQDTLGIHFDIQ